jgi:hypothetical protein
VGTPEHTIALKRAILEHGALTASIHVDDEFKTYSTGVFSGSTIEPLNHAICIIGWDDSKEAWIIRNSWGSWGQNCGWGAVDGYAYVKYGSNGVGSNARWVEALPPPNIGYATVLCEAGYVSEFTVSYVDSESNPRSQSVKLTTGTKKQFALDGHVRDVRVRGYALGVGEVFNEGPYPGPPNKCFKTYGTIFDTEWNNNCDLELNSGQLPQVDQTGYVKVFCEAGYVTRFSISYQDGSGSHSESVDLSAGLTKTWVMPNTAVNINVVGVGIGAGLFFKDVELFNLTYPSPPNACFKSFGPILDAEWNTNCD